MPGSMRRLAALAALPFLLAGCYWNTGSSGSSGSSYDAETRVRMAIPAIEAYNADHGTYKGVTLGRLRQYDMGVTGVRVVRATATGYCLESTGSGAYHKTGSAGEILPGSC
jgi:hypothetical protein